MVAPAPGVAESAARSSGVRSRRAVRTGVVTRRPVRRRRRRRRRPRHRRVTSSSRRTSRRSARRPSTRSSSADADDAEQRADPAEPVVLREPVRELHVVARRHDDHQVRRERGTDPRRPCTFQFGKYDVAHEHRLADLRHVERDRVDVFVDVVTLRRLDRASAFVSASCLMSMCFQSLRTRRGPHLVELRAFDEPRRGRALPRAELRHRASRRSTARPSTARSCRRAPSRRPARTTARSRAGRVVGYFTL